MIIFPPEIASTITIRLLLKPVDATAPTIIPAVAIAVNTNHIKAPFSNPVMTLLYPSFNPLITPWFNLIAVKTSLKTIMRNKDRIE